MYVSRESHDKSIQKLLLAHDSNENFMFGHIGVGVVPKSERNVCTAVSKGLILNLNLKGV